MCKIIGISGKKQAGKNTMANYINGLVLTKRGMIEDFLLGEKGELIIVTRTQDGRVEHGLLDVTRKDDDFVSFAEMELWPYVKMYSFADTLKSLCIDLFDLRPEQVYGTDEQKNTMTNLLVKNNTGNVRRTPATAREFMQYFGTNVCRSIKPNVWVDYLMKTIKREKTNLAIIADIRFPNEVEAIQKAGGKVVRLTREVYDDKHHSECALDQENFDWSNFDVKLDNSSGGVDLLCKEVDKLRSLWGG